MIKCINCGCDKIEMHVPVVDPFWGTPIGPKYKIGSRGKMVRTAPTYFDFCTSCGTVLRSYVEIPDNAKWLHGKNEFSNE